MFLLPVSGGRSSRAHTIRSPSLVVWVPQLSGPRISIQVIPADRPHAGLLGAFMVAENELPPAIVYLDRALDGQVVESAEVAETIDVVFRALQMEALTGSASLNKMKEAAQRWKEQITP